MSAGYRKHLDWLVSAIGTTDMVMPGFNPARPGLAPESHYSPMSAVGTTELKPDPGRYTAHRNRPQTCEASGCIHPGKFELGDASPGS